jgi:tetratricopeptide (TPR) repeat protein
MGSTTVRTPAAAKTPAPAAPKLTFETLPPSALEELRSRWDLTDAQIKDFLDAVQRGSRTVGDYLQLDEGHARALECMALAYYRERHFELATHTYNQLVQLFPERSSAWRGLGACAQVTKQYALAVICFAQALQHDASDVAAQVLLGECYCLGNKPELGMQALRRALTLPTPEAWQKDYVKRAKFILAAQQTKFDAARKNPAGSAGSKTLNAAAAGTQGEAGDPSRPAQAAATQGQVSGSPQDAESAESTETAQTAAHVAERLEAVKHIEGSEEAVRLLATPEMRAMVERITQGVQFEAICVKDVAGFTDAQLQGGYAAACDYLEQGKPLQAMQTLGWLLYLDHKNPLFLQLAGLAAHHLKLYCYADYLYGVSLIYDATDPTTLIYRGEVKILSEERHAGVALLKKGLALCGRRPELQDIAKRGQALIKQFDSKERSQKAP